MNLRANRSTRLFFLAIFATACVARAQKTPIIIAADLSDAPRKLYHAEIEIPVTPGPVTLTTPKWIPGNHRPTGPVNEITARIWLAHKLEGVR